ncbi:MAG: tetratricopeptide repeat protein [Caldilineaceae bacterium]|nr:tetratricopeptide repeat protein [Caldilineaceae bacterium]
MLSFQLLGSVSLRKDGHPLNQFRSQKEAALLIYLAHTQQACTREFMAELLWEERTTQQALSNLRTVLARLHKQIGDALLAARKTVALAPVSQQQVDSVLLLQTLATVGAIDSPAKATALQAVLTTYRGDFLADFHVPTAPHFEQWMMTTREAIRRQVITAYNKLGQFILTTGTADEGIALAHRWLTVDALDEAAHTLLLRLLLNDDQSRAAVDHYTAYEKRLRQEVDVAPSAAIKALIETAQPSGLAVQQAHGQSSKLVQLPVAYPRFEQPRHNLPAPHDQFFGRVSLQQAIGERLDQPWCRLVTLVGQGGVGKTRLATTMAYNRLSHYPDGVWLVELAAIERDDTNLAEAIAVEIATALDLRLNGAASPIEQLFSHLQHKTLLLVLDNFEHLLEGGISLVLDLIERCANIQLLVTSREALRTRAEWVVTLTGLDYPTDDNQVACTEAEALFVARRAQGRQEPLVAADRVLVQQICYLVEGLPLALELAAALTHSKPLPTIVADLRRGFDTLTTALRDVPHRHRSLQIVFAMSWRTLTKGLQTRLARLTIFRGGFTAAAAQAITDTDLDQLTALAEKSLLTTETATGRYALHPVVRAYAAAQLITADPIAQKHARYYLALLDEQSDLLQKATPQQAVAKLVPELENLRLAWHSGLAGRQADLLAAALTPLSLVYQLRGLAHEAAATMQNTVRATTAWGHAGMALATRAGLEEARFQNRLGRYRAAIASVETALCQAQTSGDHWAEGMGHILWGEALWRLDEYALSATKLHHALAIAHAIDSTLLIGWCHHHLGVIDDIQSRYAAAHAHLEQACVAWRSLENVQLLSNSLNSIGLVCYHQGDWPAAQQALEKALHLCEQIDDRHRQSNLINNLSILATEQGDYGSAHHYLQMGLDLVKRSGDLYVQGNLHTNLGRNYYLLGKLAAAEENLEQGMRIFESIGNRALLATAVLYLAETTSKQADGNRATALYQQVLSIARQDQLRLIECEALINMAEFFRKRDERAAREYSIQAVTLAETLQNPNLRERAAAINHYLQIGTR